MNGPSSLARAPVEPGDLLAQKYRVERVLGSGGMGVVVLAHHIHLGEPVALKFLLESAAESAEIVARFLREAKAATRIKGEHVARVIDVGKLENGAPYMVMEYLDGSDLAQILVDGPLRIEDAIDYLLQAMEAIAEAHALGIVHRDLKPSNLFLTHRADDSPLIKVLDFGISKTVDSVHAPSLTQTASVMGSPLYMAPEQVRSAKNVDSRTDIWSLGVILYELLAGRSPFEHETASAVFAAIVSDPPPPLRGARPDVPPALEDVITHCLAKSSADRFASVGELAAALMRFGGRHAELSATRITGILARSGRAPRAAHIARLENTAPVAGSDPSMAATEISSPALHPPAATHGAWFSTGSSVRAVPESSTLVWIILGGISALLAIVAIGSVAIWLARRPPAPVAHSEIGATTAPPLPSPPASEAIELPSVSVPTPPSAATPPPSSRPARDKPKSLPARPGDENPLTHR